MAVREFSDKNGTTWRAWDISPEAILAQTRAEEYLADCFREGWIVFENLTTGEKRRLSPYPLDWESMTDLQLESLLWLHAEPVLPGRRSHDGLRAVAPRAGDDTVGAVAPTALSATALGASRAFTYPGGGAWDVRVAAREDGGAPVLRFRCGARCIDRGDWPADWAGLSDAQLAALLRSAAPRTERWRDGLPRRRHGDFDGSAEVRA